jgi:hypothetical protein
MAPKWPSATASEPSQSDDLGLGQNFLYSFDHVLRLGDRVDDLFLQLPAAQISRAVPVEKFFLLAGKIVFPS